jgi:hypothetical protein
MILKSISKYNGKKNENIYTREWNKVLPTFA